MIRTFIWNIVHALVLNFLEIKKIYLSLFSKAITHTKLRWCAFVNGNETLIFFFSLLIPSEFETSYFYLHGDIIICIGSIRIRTPWWQNIIGNIGYVTKVVSGIQNLIMILDSSVTRYLWRTRVDFMESLLIKLSWKNWLGTWLQGSQPYRWLEKEIRGRLRDLRIFWCPWVETNLFLFL